MCFAIDSAPCTCMKKQMSVTNFIHCNRCFILLRLEHTQLLLLMVLLSEAKITVILLLSKANTHTCTHIETNRFLVVLVGLPIDAKTHDSSTSVSRTRTPTTNERNAGSVSIMLGLCKLLCCCCSGSVWLLRLVGKAIHEFKSRRRRRQTHKNKTKQNGIKIKNK